GIRVYSALLRVSTFFLLSIPRPPRSTRFPYTTLFRSIEAMRGHFDDREWEVVQVMADGERHNDVYAEILGLEAWPREQRDREVRSEEHTSDLQSLTNIVCRLVLEKTNSSASHHCCAEQ